MATTTPQEKTTFMNNNTPLRDHDHEREEDDIDIDDYEDIVSPSGCDCFQLFCFKWHRNNGNDHRHLLHQKGEYYRDSWLVNKLKKVKEISESLAGPKFKTLIRKISGYCKNNKMQKNNRFQYDAHSYALNFDNGVDREDDSFLR